MIRVLAVDDHPLLRDREEANVLASAAARASVPRESRRIIYVDFPRARKARIRGAAIAAGRRVWPERCARAGEWEGTADDCGDFLARAKKLGAAQRSPAGWRRFTVRRLIATLLYAVGGATICGYERVRMDVY